jgi:hypothetical protein
MNLFSTQYHISVDSGLIDDFTSIGVKMFYPDDTWGDKIKFFRSNREHEGKPNFHLVSYDQFLMLGDLAFLIPCEQLWGDFHELMKARNNPNDKLILLTAQNNFERFIPKDYVKNLLSHDSEFHRISGSPNKMLYFSKPLILLNEQKDLKNAFESKKVTLYTNGFTGAGFEPEYTLAKEFRDEWLKHTGYNIQFYGHGNELGQISMPDVQRNMLDSMFTLVFKRRETWGQMVNESMLLGTPCIFSREFITSTFIDYEITPDTAVIKEGESIPEFVDRILSMSFDEYVSLSYQAQAIAELFTSEQPRRKQLKRFMDRLL